MQNSYAESQKKRATYFGTFSYILDLYYAHEPDDFLEMAMLTDFYFHSQWENRYKAKAEFLIQAKLQQIFQEKGRKESNVFELLILPVWLCCVFVVTNYPLVGYTSH